MKRKFNNDHDHRPRASPFQIAVARIRKSLAEIGEPGTGRDSSAYAQLASEISASDQEAWPAIQEMIAALVLEQPHKVPHIAYILELVNLQRSAIPEQILDLAQERLQAALLDRDQRKVCSWLRFVCSLTIVEKPHLSDLLEDLLAAGNIKAVVTAVVYLKAAMDKTDLSTLEQKLATFCQEFTREEKLDLPLVAAYDPRSETEYYVQAVRKALESGWDIGFMPAFDSFGPRSANPLPKITLKAFNSSLTRQPQTVYTRVYPPQDGIHSVPEPNTLFALVLREVASQIIANMDFSRKEVIRQLMSLDLFFNEEMFAPPSTPFENLKELQDEGLATIKPEEVAVEAVLAEMLRLPEPEFPAVYYHSILIEACIMFPEAAAPVLGRAVRFFFANAQTLDAEVFWRIVSWWAHHMSNFSFTWKWHEWKDCLNLSHDHPKYVFMHQLVVKQVQLSYPARVRESLPTEFSHLVPEVPEVPFFKYQDDEDVEKLLDNLTNKPQEIESTIQQFKRQLTDKLVGQEASQLAKEYGSILITCLCQLGSRSITHATKWIERLAPFLKDSVAGNLVVETTLDYWKQSPWVGLLVLDKLVNSGVIQGSDVSRHVLATESLLMSSAGYDRLKLYGIPKESGTSGSDYWVGWWYRQVEKVSDRAAASAHSESAPAEPETVQESAEPVKDSVEPEPAEPEPEPEAVEAAPIEAAAVEAAPIEAVEPVKKDSV